jgi:hypothetical protein
MQRSIRHADGTAISRGEWTSIKASARLILLDLLRLPPPQDPCNRSIKKDLPKTKTYFRNFFPIEWQKALVDLETLQPLIALCAPHWKAEHVLGNMLQNRLRKRKANDDGNSNDGEFDDDANDGGGDDNSSGIKAIGDSALAKKHHQQSDFPDPKRRKFSVKIGRQVGTQDAGMSVILSIFDLRLMSRLHRKAKGQGHSTTPYLRLFDSNRIIGHAFRCVRRCHRY